MQHVRQGGEGLLLSLLLGSQRDGSSAARSSRHEHPARTSPFFSSAVALATASPMQSSTFFTALPSSSDRRGCMGMGWPG